MIGIKFIERLQLCQHHLGLYSISDLERNLKGTRLVRFLHDEKYYFEVDREAGNTMSDTICIYFKGYVLFRPTVQLSACGDLLFELIAQVSL